MPEQVEDFLANFLELESQVHEHLGGDALLLTQQTQQDVLGTDVVVAEL